MTTTTLVVVESPNKITKVTKCLGPGFKVVATLGHFRDLPEDELGVDVASWTPSYQTLRTKASVVPKLRAAAAEASQVLLATDADREGEAIAWHVAQVLGLEGAKRIRFQEITPAALKRAVAEATALDGHLVDAQQARRVVDRLVGYQVSPLLRAFGPNHSAGRVQSATLHLVVLREVEREAFTPVPFWILMAHYAEGFSAKYAAETNGRWAPARFTSEAEARAAEALAEAAPHRVEALDTAPVEQKPKAPFTTSTLQQAASATLSFTPAKTMAAAQALFEKGAITYHRTDSVALSDEAIAMARDFLSTTHPDALPTEPVRYRNAATAQEAHEAIRPTAMQLEPDVTLRSDEEALYSLISRRFLACQCRPAVLQRTTVRTEGGGVRFLATGSVVTTPSFLAFLAEDEEKAAAKYESGDAAAGEEKRLPRLATGAALELKHLGVRPDTTKPPPRFTQATLIREMERQGIGRPSTYAATVGTLFERSYLGEEKKGVLPTPRGRLVDGALAAAFPTLVAAQYTAQLEARLDDIAAGVRHWKAELTDWYRPFSRLVGAAQSAIAAYYNANRAFVDAVSGAPKPTGKPCPRCAKELLLKEGKKGPFLGCSGYPACTYAADPSAHACAHRCPKCDGAMEEVDGKFGPYARCLAAACGGRLDTAATTTHLCPRCGSPMKDRGAFLGCSRYPECSHTLDKKALEKAEKRGTRCPKCKRPVVEKRGPRGKFLGCSGYPACTYTQELPARRAKRGAHV